MPIKMQGPAALAFALVLGTAPVSRADEPETAKIRDNLFLLEEAYNQEPGVIQHIQVLEPGPAAGAWSYSFTEEWPAPTDRHQLSVTVPLSGVERGSPLGDLLLNYRLQAVGMGGVGPLAIAPRLSLVLPTADPDNGAGRGRLGVQANLPVSIELGDRFVTHLNAGATFTSGTRQFDTNAGVALVFLARSYFNALVEVVHESEEDFAPDGSRVRRHTVTANPGIRFAANVGGGLQIVPGLSLPIELTAEGPRVGGLLYLSFEHPLWTP